MNLQDVFKQVKSQVEQYLEQHGTLSDEELMNYIEDVVFDQIEGGGVQEKSSLIHKVFASFRGYDVLQPLLDDPEVTEIMVNRHDEIFIEKHGEITLIQDAFESKEKLEHLIQMIVGKVNRIVNESTPIVDARLLDGSRVNVVLPPLALKGPTLTIRRFPQRPMKLPDLIKLGGITEEAAAWLKKVVQAKYNLFISGGTGSGKTTMLGALGDCIPKEERVITIEDSAELQLPGIPNLVQLETRNANSEGKGRIDMSALIRTALRMRPNRIVIGEVRGAEAADMLQAMNTGHDGSLSTGHANSCRDMLTRLETMVLSGMDIPLTVIRQQLASAIDVMIHLQRLRTGKRVVTEICELRSVASDQYLLEPIYKWDGSRLVKTGSVLANDEKWQMVTEGEKEGGEQPCALEHEINQ